MDNLESQTYETFEKDPIKYAKYQQVWSEVLIQQPFIPPFVDRPFKLRWLTECQSRQKPPPPR